MSTVEYKVFKTKANGGQQYDVVLMLLICVSFNVFLFVVPRLEAQSMTTRGIAAAGSDHIEIHYPYVVSHVCTRRTAA